MAHHDLELRLVVAERAAQHRGPAEQVEEPWRHRHRDGDLGRVVSGNPEWRDEREVALEPFERVVHRLEVFEVRGRERIARAALAGGVAPHVDEPLVVGIGQGLEEHAVDHRKDGAVGANAERERDDGEGRHERRLEGETAGVPHVGAEGVPEHHVSP